MTTKPNRFTFDIQAVIDTARLLGQTEAQERPTRQPFKEWSDNVSEIARLKEENRVIQAMVNGNRECDHALADKAREALRLRGWNPVNVAGIGTGITQLIAFLDHSMPVKPPGETA